MTYQPDQSLLDQLRDAARVECNELTRHQIRETADELGVALAAFRDQQTGDRLEKINGLWTKGVRLLGFAKVAA